MFPEFSFDPEAGLSVNDAADMAKSMLEAGASAYLSKRSPQTEVDNTLRKVVRDRGK
jgi:DNA-binding NarL/FixJ family response regulator